MINNKGQTLVLFIILIPILLLLAAFVVDTGILIRENTRLNSITKTIIDEVIDSDDKTKEIEELYLKNGISIANLEVVVEDNKVKIKNNYDIDSVFGNIIGITKYNVKIDITAIKNENNIKYIKE